MKTKINQVTDVSKVNTIKVEDFDEAILVVQVRVGKFEVKDVLLDGGFGVNINSKSLKKKLGLRKSQPTSFIICMVDQHKVQAMGLIQNLKINLTIYVYKILIIVLKMENGIEAYSMFLERPWLKQAKAHHNWGDSTLLIILENIRITLNIIKQVNIKSSQS